MFLCCIFMTSLLGSAVGLGPLGLAGEKAGDVPN